MAQSGQPPLVGIKVLDLSRIIAGPLCCQQMADMGADVLKVENPKTGDDLRNATKPWAGKDSHFSKRSTETNAVSDSIFAKVRGRRFSSS